MVINGYGTNIQSCIQLLIEFVIIGMKPCIKSESSIFELEHALQRLQWLNDNYDNYELLQPVHQTDQTGVGSGLGLESGLGLYETFECFDKNLQQIGKIVVFDRNLLEYCILLVERIHYVSISNYPSIVMMSHCYIIFATYVQSCVS